MDKGLRSLLSITVLILLIMPLYAGTIVAAYSHALRLSPILKSGGSYRWAWLVLQADQVPGLVGADARTLRAALCVDGRLVEAPVVLVPRNVTWVWLASAGRRVPLPYYGDPRLKPSDVILVMAPVPATQSLSMARCGWGVRYALARLHYRARILLPSGTALRALNGRLVKLTAPLVLYLYFDRKPVRVETAEPLPLLTAVAKSLGIKRDKNLTWIMNLRSKLRALALRYSRSLSIELVHVKGWLISRDLRKVLEQPWSMKLDGRPRAQGLVEPDFYYIDGRGGGIDKLYWFTLILNVDPSTGNEATMRLGQLTRSIYIGPYIESVGLHALVSSSGGACIKASLKIYRASDGKLVYSVERSYYLGQGESEIDLYAAPGYGSQELRAVASLSSCGGNAYVELATLDFTKSFPQMPVEQTRTGLKVLAYGIASSGYSSLSRIHYAYGDGLEYPSTVTRLALSYGGFNGIYLDYLSGNDNAYLYVDLVVENNAVTWKTGSIKINANGFNVAEKTVSVPPGYYRVVRFTIPLRRILDYQEWGGGGILTVENTFNDPKVKLYLDAALTYKYLPEVWGPGSVSWCVYRNPALKLELNIPSSTAVRGGFPAVPFKASLVVDTSCVMYGTNTYMPVGVRIVKAKWYSGAVGSILVRVKIPAGLVEYAKAPPQAYYKTDKRFGEGLDKYIGEAITLHTMISTGLGIVDFLVELPPWVGAAAFVSGVALDVIKASLGGGSARYVGTEYIDGMKYYVYEYMWDPGLSRPSRVEVKVAEPLAPGMRPGTYKVYVAMKYYEKGVWGLNDIPVTIKVAPESYGHISPPGFYGRRDLNYS